MKHLKGGFGLYRLTTPLEFDNETPLNDVDKEKISELVKTNKIIIIEVQIGNFIYSFICNTFIGSDAYAIRSYDSSNQFYINGNGNNVSAFIGAN